MITSAGNRTSVRLGAFSSSHAHTIARDSYPNDTILYVEEA